MKFQRTSFKSITYTCSIISHNLPILKVKKGMYSLKQVTILAYNQLKRTLAPHGHHPIPNTVGLWKYESKSIQFCLCINDFSIKYENTEDVEHLIQALQNRYKIIIDWSGRHYCGPILDWDYMNRYANISMPGYIEKLLTRLAHLKPAKPVHSPHAFTLPSMRSL